MRRLPSSLCSVSPPRPTPISYSSGSEPPAEAGRSAEVFFSEQAEAGDPKFVAKIAHTVLWIQTRPGEFRELPTNQAADRLRASLPSDRTLAIVGKCEYGVLARPKETPFLLRYYPKAVAGNADELNRLTPRQEIPFEIQPIFENQATDNDKFGVSRIRLVALRNGKPVPNAVFTAVDSDLSASKRSRPIRAALRPGPRRLPAVTPSMSATRSRNPAFWEIKSTTKSANSPR